MGHEWHGYGGLLTQGCFVVLLRNPHSLSVLRLPELGLGVSLGLLLGLELGLVLELGLGLGLGVVS